jgi:hypothetical protein
MSLQEFQVSLRRRIRIPFDTEPQKCICNSKTLVDIHGIHLSTGCNVGDGRIKTHNAMRDTIHDLFKSCGFTSKLEEKNLFQDIDNSNGKRPDISIMHLPGSKNQKTIIDVTIVAPYSLGITNRLSSRKFAQTKFRQAERAHKSKESKYLKISQASNLGFLPLCFEMTGSIYLPTYNIFQKVIAAGAVIKKCSFQYLYQYWMQTLNVTLQKNLANSLIASFNKLSSRQTSQSMDLSAEAIHTFSYAHCAYANLW